MMIFFTIIIFCLFIFVAQGQHFSYLHARQGLTEIDIGVFQGSDGTCNEKSLLLEGYEETETIDLAYPAGSMENHRTSF